MKILALFVGLVASSVPHAQARGADEPHKWVNSYEAHKANIRSLAPAPKKACESQLRQILKSIDDNATCSVDSDCTLLNQDPFGSTVPVRIKKGDALLSQMKQYKNSCDNNSFHASQSIATISVATCVKNRCMVRIGSK